MNSIIRFCLENKLIVSFATVFVVLWGVIVAPFEWSTEILPNNPVPVDAIPDIGENQQHDHRAEQQKQEIVQWPAPVATHAVSGLKSRSTHRSCLQAWRIGLRPPGSAAVRAEF